MLAIEVKKAAANKTLHIQIERKSRRTWQCPNIRRNNILKYEEIK